MANGHLQPPRARPSGPWTKQKLEFLAKYLSAYVKATQRIRRSDVCYMDLCAGPGRDKIQSTNETVDGSPLISMNLAPGFRRFIFGDIDGSNLAQLELEAKRLDILDQVHTIVGDANLTIDNALQYAPQDGATFCFIDPPGIDIHWSTIRKVAHYRPVQNRKAELFILFAYGMDLVRFLVREGSPEDIWGPGSVDRIDSALPNLVNWREVYESRNSGQIVAGEAKRRFAYIYWMGLRSLGYKFVLNPKLISTPTGQDLYFLFFASDHEVGGKIMSDVLKDSQSPRQLGFGQIEESWLIQDPWEFVEGENWYLNMLRDS